MRSQNAASPALANTERRFRRRLRRFAAEARAEGVNWRVLRGVIRQNCPALRSREQLECQLPGGFGNTQLTQHLQPLLS
jgi:hypothetical protein